MKRRLTLLIIGLILALILAACSAGSDRSPAEKYESSAGGTSSLDGGYDDETGEQDPAAQLTDRRIIRNASLTLITADVKASYEQFLSFVIDQGGYELQQTTRAEDDTISIDAQLRVPPEHLDACLDHAATLGDVRYVATDTEDITEKYYDAQTRLKSMETALERYYDYLDEADSIEESLSVQAQINQLTMEIEAIKGRLQLWQSQLKESTITLTLRQLNDPVQTRRDISWKALSWSDMGYLMRSGLQIVASFAVNVLQWFAVVLVAAAPIWIPALIIILILRHRARRRRRKMAGQPSSEAAAPESTQIPDQKA